MTLADLKKIFSKDASIQVGDYKEMSKFPTGLINLDRALGGGLPMGRLLEIYGPPESGKTSFSMYIIDKAQKAGLPCAMIDMELKTDLPSSIERQGLTEDIFFKATPYGEDAVHFAMEFMANGGKLIVIDSLAKLLPKSFYEKDIEDSAGIGIHSRFAGRALTMLAECAYENDAIVIFTNQIRTKINGNAPACFKGTTKVVMGDGTHKIIKEVQVGDSVLSINPETSLVRPQKVEAVHQNATTRDWMKIHFEGDGNALTCTPQHHFLVNKEFKAANELKAGDVLFSIYKKMSVREEQVITGMLLASGYLSKDSGDHSSRLCWYKKGDPEYEQWRKDQLSTFSFGTTANQQDKSMLVRSEHRLDLTGLRNKVYVKDITGSEVFTVPKLESISALAMAFWYMDSNPKVLREKSSLSLRHAKKLTVCNESVINAVTIVQNFCEQTEGISFDASKFRIDVEGDALEVLTSKLAGVLPANLWKYLPRKYTEEDSIVVTSLVTESEPLSTQPRLGYEKVVVESTELIKSALPHERYDLTVANNHTYFVKNDNGGKVTVAVHNSLDSPGGYNAKHQMILRISIRRKEDVKDKTGAVIGIRSYIDINKYQSTRLAREKFEIDILYKNGISPIRVLKDELEYCKLVIRRGAWYFLEEELATELGLEPKIGQGGDSVIEFLTQRPELANDLYERLLNYSPS